ncbi:TIGR02611 family protein [Mycolicibacterium vaccae]|uniref:TIGR02611 family protein n=1 Tax=Mycolicibacterium vaccae TaxID=1810 RepID=UPI003D07FDB0
MSAGRGSGIAQKWARWRDGVRRRPMVDLGYRITVGVVGMAVLTVGIIAIPYPGPGWAIVFLGLGILATEFEWAQRLLRYARRRYDAAMDWFKQQGLWVQIAGAVLTFAVVMGTLWLFGALAFAGRLVNIEHPWLHSPIGLGG